jgi:copper chaperone CopZ
MWTVDGGLVPRFLGDPVRRSLGEAEMTNINLADVTVHIDESIGDEVRVKVENHLRSVEGVTSVHFSKDRPHLLVVTYDPNHAASKKILEAVLGEQLHAELIGM